MGKFIPLPGNKPSHFPQYQLALALKTRVIILDKVYGVQLWGRQDSKVENYVR